MSLDPKNLMDALRKLAVDRSELATRLINAERQIKSWAAQAGAERYATLQDLDTNVAPFAISGDDFWTAVRDIITQHRNAAKNS
jgi:hypothetical protein